MAALLSSRFALTYPPIPSFPETFSIAENPRSRSKFPENASCGSETSLWCQWLMFLRRICPSSLRFNEIPIKLKVLRKGQRVGRSREEGTRKCEKGHWRRIN